MTCQEFRQKMDEESLITVDPQFLKETHSHIQECSSCREYWEWRCRLSREIKKLTRATEPNPDVWKRIEMKITTEPVWQKKIWLIAASLIITLMTAWSMRNWYQKISVPTDHTNWNQEALQVEYAMAQAQLQLTRFQPQSTRQSELIDSLVETQLSEIQKLRTQIAQLCQRYPMNSDLAYWLKVVEDQALALRLEQSQLSTIF